MAEMDFLTESYPTGSSIDSFSPFASVTGAAAAATAPLDFSLDQQQPTNNAARTNAIMSEAAPSSSTNNKSKTAYLKDIVSKIRQDVNNKKAGKAVAAAAAAASSKPVAAPATKPTLMDDETEALADSVISSIPPEVMDASMEDDDDHSHADSDSEYEQEEENKEDEEEEDDNDGAESEGEFIASNKNKNTHQLVRIPVVPAGGAAAAKTPAVAHRKKLVQGKRKDQNGLVPFAGQPGSIVQMHTLDIGSFNNNKELSTFVKSQAMMLNQVTAMMSTAVSGLATNVQVGFEQTRSAIEQVDKKNEERYQQLERRMQQYENNRLVAVEDQMFNADTGAAYLRTLWLTGALCVFVKATLDEILKTPDRMMREAGMKVEVTMSKELREAHRIKPTQYANALILGRPAGMDYNIAEVCRSDRARAIKDTVERWQTNFFSNDPGSKVCVIWVDHMDLDFADYSRTVDDVVNTFTMYDGLGEGEMSATRKRERPRKSGPSSKFVHMTNVNAKIATANLLPLTTRTVVPVPSISALCKLKIGSVSVLSKARVALCRLGVVQAGVFMANDIDKIETALKLLQNMGLFDEKRTTAVQAADINVPTVVRCWFGLLPTSRNYMYHTGLHNIMEHLALSFAQVRLQDIPIGSDSKSFAPKNPGLPVCAYVLHTEEGRRCLRPVEGTPFDKLYHKQVTVNQLMAGGVELQVEEMPSASDLHLLWDEMALDNLKVRNEDAARVAAEEAAKASAGTGGAAGGLGNVVRGANGKFASKKSSPAPVDSMDLEGEDAPAPSRLTGSKRSAPEPGTEAEDDTIPPPAPKRQKVRSAARSLTDAEVEQMRMEEEEEEEGDAEQPEEEEEEQEDEEEEQEEEEEEVSASQRPTAASKKRAPAKKAPATAASTCKRASAAAKQPAPRGGAKKLGGRRRG